MNPTAALGRYRTVQEQTTPPERVLLRLLEALCADMEEAKSAVKNRDIPTKARIVDRATQVLGELTAALDAKTAPELAAQLTSLYAFAQRRINEGSAGLDPVAFDDARRVLSSIHASFRDAVEIWHGAERDHAR